MSAVKAFGRRGSLAGCGTSDQKVIAEDEPPFPCESSIERMYTADQRPLTSLGDPTSGGDSGTTPPPDGTKDSGWTAAEVGATGIGVAIGLVAIALAATAGVGAVVGMGVAAAVSGDKPPQYKKGAVIGAGAGLAGSILIPILTK